MNANVDRITPLNRSGLAIFRVVKLALSFIYLTLLTYIVFFARRRRTIHRRYLNLIPVKKTFQEFLMAGTPRLPRWDFYSNFVGNIFLFIPLSFVLMNYGRTENIKRTVLIACGISFCIELIQYSFEIGYADVDDVILNTIGAAFGAYLFIFFRRQGLVQFD